MIPTRRVPCYRAGILMLAAIVFVSPVPSFAQEPSHYPTAEEVDAMLRAEPIGAATWPVWRDRLAAWFHDPTPAPDEAYWAAKHFFREQSGGRLALPERYRDDYLAWYFLSGSYLHAPGATVEELGIAEAACRRCIALEPAFARGHRNLAMALIAEPNDGDAGHLNEAERELAEARRLDPLLSVAPQTAAIAASRQRMRPTWNRSLGAVIFVGALLAVIVLVVVVVQVRGNKPTADGGAPS